ncbi:50S ribosomal protein L21e [Candidatus Bathyarchaeota archaeon]|nr:50S ribosomal protein L21e [Candidatus Bathyarchaeota archaeon]
MPKSKGYRRGTRKLLRKKQRERGLQPLGRLLHEYKPDEKVVIIIDSSVHKGMPHRRYHGRVGLVKEKRGRAYTVKLKVGNKEKTIILRPEHMRQHKG